MRVRTWDSLSKPNFVRNRLRGHTFFDKFLPKITKFGYFRAVSPQFKSDNGEIWSEDTDQEHRFRL